jgi:hypothetical protein
MSKQSKRVFAPSFRNPHSAIRIPLLAVTATILGALLTEARAADASPASAVSFAPTAEHSAMLIVIVGLVGVGTVINLGLSIWDKIKPKPPYHRQFAALQHDHSGYQQVGECSSRHAALLAEAKEAVRIAVIDRRSVEDKLLAVESSLRAEIKENDRKAEQRASETHSRINGLAAPLNALLGRFEDHLRAQHKERHG